LDEQDPFDGVGSAPQTAETELTLTPELLQFHQKA
jgi:hypothetical protein